MTPEKLYTDILLGFEERRLSTKEIKRPKGVLKAVEVFKGDSPLGRVYLRSKSVHVRVRGAARTEQVSSVHEAADLLAPAELPAAGPPPVTLSEALAAFGRGDIEAAQDKAHAVLETSPGNEAARRLLEKCEKLLRSEQAAAVGDREGAEEEEAVTEEAREPERLEVGVAPPERFADEDAAVVEEAAPAEIIAEQDVAGEMPSISPAAGPIAEEPPEARERARADLWSDEAPAVAVAAEPPREVTPPLEAAAPPVRPVRPRRSWRGFAWFGLAAIVVLVLVFALRRRDEAPKPAPPEPEEVSPEQRRRDQLADMGERARRMEATGRFWGGEASAGALYAALLAEEPSSPSARVGVLRVADTLRSLADSSFTSANFVTARSHYEGIAELLRECLTVVPRDSAFQRRHSEAQDLAGVSKLRAELFRSMVYVPSGAFIRGDNDGPLDSRPRRRHVLREFWIDRHEVTNEEYAVFVQASGHSTPSHWPEGGVPGGLGSEPVVNVTWSDAAAYAQWAGKRLPTEAEWEKAARGTEGNRYPWGSRFSAELCNTSEGGVRGVANAGSYRGGASPYGVSEMAGNVREWTADFYDGRYYVNAPERDPKGPRGGVSRVVRGGSWRLSREWALTFARSRLRPDEAHSDLGFRCASDKGPPPLGDPAATPVAE